MNNRNTYIWNDYYVYVVISLSWPGVGRIIVKWVYSANKSFKKKPLTHYTFFTNIVLQAYMVFKLVIWFESAIFNDKESLLC